MTSATEPTFPYEDPAVGVDRRVEDLLSRMDLADKAGLLFHAISVFEDIDDGNPMFDMPPLRERIIQQHITHYNVIGGGQTAREFAAWHNAAQQIAMTQPLAVPITFSSDPRHAFSDNPGVAMSAGPFSQWPEPLGLAAIGSPAVTREHGDIARQEYLAVGLRAALHPQVDLATEPRWSRINGTFGEDADLTAAMVHAYIEGYQGAVFGPGSVSTMTKHFPGGGPQRDGEDPHFSYGREQVYPGGMFEHHLKPFTAAIAAGTRQIMPSYGVPVGTDYDEVGFGFHRAILTGLLRQRLGFDGVICTDWRLLTDTVIMGQTLPAAAWGAEHLDRADRALMILDAGADQFGGEHCPEVLLALHAGGKLSEERIEESARRLLREKFLLGLFDHPYVDPDAAEVIVGSQAFRAAGEQAQSASLTVLTNAGPADTPVLPLAAGLSVYAEGLDTTVLAQYATPAAIPTDADIAILRLHAPFETRGGAFEALFHAGSLEFNTSELDRISAIATVVPTVLQIYLDRPAILSPLVDTAAAVVVDYGASTQAILAVLFGDRSPQGSLPFDLPRSMAAVVDSRTDVPFDTHNPLFRFGHGLRYRPDDGAP